MNTVELPIHTSVLGVEYVADDSDVKVSDEVGATAFTLCQRVVVTACNQLVRHRQWRVCRPVTSYTDERFDYAIISCMLPNSGITLPRLSPMLLKDIDRGDANQPEPRDFARLCLLGASKVLGEAGLYDAATRAFVSGPRPVRHVDLLNAVAYIPALSQPVSIDAKTFAASVEEVCGVVFEHLTGGAIPAVDCQVEYGPLE